MNGRVNALQALMSVTFRFEHRPDLAIEFVVDTGFAGHLTLPSSAVEALRLPFVFNSSARLANDSVIDVGVYAATIVWHGEEHSVDVLATGTRPLLGTLLLDGSELNVQFTEDGQVSVESL
jgi:clan AA aspartic protease